MEENKVQKLMQLLVSMIDDGGKKNTVEQPTPITEDKPEYIVAFKENVKDKRTPTQSKTTEEMVQNLRQLSNFTYSKRELDTSINLLNIAIELTKHSPVLFTNRAMCFMQSDSFKRAVIDCDYVINKLDEKNLNAWLFRAKCYFELGAKLEYTKSVNEAKKNNPKKATAIEEFAKNLSLSRLTK